MLACVHVFRKKTCFTVGVTVTVAATIVTLCNCVVAVSCFFVVVAVLAADVDSFDRRSAVPLKVQQCYL